MRKKRSKKEVFWTLRAEFTLAEEPCGHFESLEEAIKEWYRLGGKSQAYRDKYGKPDRLLIVPIEDGLLNWKKAFIPKKRLK